MAKLIKTIIILSVVSLIAVSVYVYFNGNYAKEDVYRPMCFYDNSLMWEEGKAETDFNDSEYLGTINFCVGATQKPAKDFECNYESWLGAQLYKDKNDIYYLKLLNGNTVELKRSRTCGEMTVVVPYN